MQANTTRVWILSSALLLAAAVLLGAFGAHALKGVLDSTALEVYKTANFYHFIHALGLLCVLALPKETLASDFRRLIAVLLVVGMLLFCGSLYALALSGLRMLGMITPFGGLLFVAAWLLLAYGAWRSIETKR